MFGKKKHEDDIPVGETTTPSTDDQLHISTIPNTFYGGKNPELYELPTYIQKEAPSAVIQEPDTSEDDMIGAPKDKKKLFIGIGIGVFILVVAAATVYYLYDAKIIFQPKETEIEQQPVVTPTVPLPVVPEPPEPTAPEAPEPEPPVVPEPPTTTLQIEFPAIRVDVTDDLDFDDLTNEEEAVLGTDPGIWDSDDDGYFDGQEVQNLYNPNGFAPVEIIDSSVVSEYVSSEFGYQVYYPSAWDIAAVTTDEREVLISNITGDYIAIYSRELEDKVTITDWIIAFAKEQKITDITSFTNRFDTEGFKRKDGLVGYFLDDNIIYVIVYYPDTRGPVAYKQIMNIVLQSFRTNSDLRNSISPVQPIVPIPTTSTPAGAASSTTSTIETEATTSTTL